MTHYIGLDAHSTTCTFVCIDSNGKETTSAQVPTSESQICHFLSSLKGNKKLVFEESTMSKWLHTILHDRVDELVVCNPVYIIRKRGQKDDYRDGLHLAQELRKGHLISVFHSEDNIYIPLRTLVSSYRDVVTDEVRAKNRLKAIFRSQGMAEKGTTLYTDPGRITDLKGEFHQFSADALMYQIQVLGEIKSRHILELKANMKKYKILKLLDTIPQVDARRANLIAAYTCDGKRFKSKHQYWAYVGLVRYNNWSDNRYYGSRKVHSRKELKTVFMSIAQGLIGSENSLGRYYDKMRSQGLDHKKARKALARKVAAIVLSIFKTEKAYNDKYEEQTKNVKK